MQRRGLFAVALLLTALMAAPAGAKVLSDAAYDQLPDAVGDGDPDINGLKVSSNSSGSITFIVGIGNRQRLAENEFVQVYLDADNSQTGQQPNGVDYVLQMDQNHEVGLFRWNGQAFTPVQAQSAYGYVFNGFRFTVNKSDIGGVAGGVINWWAQTISGQKSDEAPDGHIAQHRLSPQQLQLRISEFGAAAGTVKVGKRFAVAMRVTRSDLEETTSDGIVRCVAKVGTKSVKVQAVFPDDIAGCIGTAPKTAKGKTLKVTVSLTLDGVTASRTASIKVR